MAKDFEIWLCSELVGSYPMSLFSVQENSGRGEILTVIQHISTALQHFDFDFVLIGFFFNVCICICVCAHAHAIKAEPFQN